MSVFSQTLFPLVCGNFMSFSFLSARHSTNPLKFIFLLSFFDNLACKCKANHIALYLSITNNYATL